MRMREVRLRLFKTLVSVGVGLSLAATAFLASGCEHVNIFRAGTRPDLKALGKTLRVHESTQQHVLSILGSPYGKGRAMFPFDKKAKTVWTYYYEEGVLQEDFRRMFLFVFFEEGLLDGYMWFSSLPGSSSFTEAPEGKYSAQSFTP